MGMRVGVVICVTFFLLGIIFTHWIADSLTLWKSPITNENIWTSFSYYSLLAHAPTQFGYALAAFVAFGAATILWSFVDGAAENLMFDGASIFLYGTAIAVYLYKVMPSFDEIFSVAPSTLSPERIPPLIKSEVLNIASANLVCSVALTGVIALQAARWWAESSGEDDVEGLRSDDTSQRRTSRKHREAPKLSTSRLAAPASSTAKVR